MNSSTIYKEILMDHYRHPRNYYDVNKSAVVRRGSNPRCGDELKIGVDFTDKTLIKVVFQGRGCSVCIASASMMTESVIGLTKNDALKLYEDIKLWFDKKDVCVLTLPEPLTALDALRKYQARRRCVMLAWEALEDAIKTQ